MADIEYKFFNYEVAVTGGLEGLCKAPDEKTAKEWIRDDLSVGDLDIEELTVSLREIPSDLVKGRHLDIGPEQ